MNAFLSQFESKSKHSTVSREAAAATAVTSHDSQSEYTFYCYISYRPILSFYTVCSFWLPFALWTIFVPRNNLWV